MAFKELDSDLGAQIRAMMLSAIFANLVVNLLLKLHSITLSPSPCITLSDQAICLSFIKKPEKEGHSLALGFTFQGQKNGCKEFKLRSSVPAHFAGKEGLEKRCSVEATAKSLQTVLAVILEDDALVFLGKDEIQGIFDLFEKPARPKCRRWSELRNAP